MSFYLIKSLIISLSNILFLTSSLSVKGLLDFASSNISIISPKLYNIRR